MTQPRPFRFGVQAAQANRRADWVDLARACEDLGYQPLGVREGFARLFPLSDTQEARGVARPAATR